MKESVELILSTVGILMLIGVYLFIWACLKAAGKPDPKVDERGPYDNYGPSDSFRKR